MVDGGHDLETALRRAARERGISLQQARPPTAALQAAIRDYRELFRPQQSKDLQAQRQLALHAMQTFAEFRPHLVGAPIHGDGPLDRVRLLLFADTPEQVMLHLSDRHIPWQDAEVVLHYSGGRRIARPALRFLAGETTVELVILDRQSRSDPPRDAITGGRLEMLDAAEVGALAAQTAT